MENPNFFFTSSRLAFRLYAEEYLPFLQECIFSDPIVSKFLFNGSTFSSYQTRAFINRNFSKQLGPVGLYLLVRKEDGEAIGLSGLLPFEQGGFSGFEFGFAIAQIHQQKGYATEAAHAQMAIGRQFLGQARLFALVHPANKASVYLLKDKLGLCFKKEINFVNRGRRLVFEANVAKKNKGWLPNSSSCKLFCMHTKFPAQLCVPS